MKFDGEAPLYDQIVQEFAASGARLIRSSITERYRGLVPEGTRLLEAGFIPPHQVPKVLIVSYYPNASDLNDPGTAAYDRVRANFETWAASGSITDYALAYGDWLAGLDHIPFHRNRTKPILDAVGLTNEEFAWLPFVKVPLPARSSPGDDILDVDVDALWEQLRLLRPRIIWIQGIGIRDRIEGLVKDRITDMILPAQSVSQYDSPANQRAERERISKRLREYLALAS
jgi:hypothetical protein